MELSEVQLSDIGNASVVWLWGREAKSFASTCVRLSGYRPWVRIEARGVSMPEFAASLKKDHKVLITYSFSERENLYGFRVDRATAADDAVPPKMAAFKYWTMSCESIRHARIVEQQCKRRGYKLVDDRTSFLLKLSADLGINPGAYVDVSSLRKVDDRLTTCQLEFETTIPMLTPLKPEEYGASTTGKIMVALDAEAQSQDGLFPVLEKGAYSFCWSVVVWRTDMFDETGKVPKTFKGLFYVGDVDVPPEYAADPWCMVRTFATPWQMLEGMREFVAVECDADIITGWNIYAFDFPFLINEYLLHFEPLSKRYAQSLETVLGEWLQPAAVATAVEKPKVGGIFGRRHHPKASAVASLSTVVNAYQFAPHCRTWWTETTELLVKERGMLAAIGADVRRHLKQQFLQRLRQGDSDVASWQATALRWIVAKHLALRNLKERYADLWTQCTRKYASVWNLVGSRWDELRERINTECTGDRRVHLHAVLDGLSQMHSDSKGLDDEYLLALETMDRVTRQMCLNGKWASRDEMVDVWDCRIMACCVPSSPALVRLRRLIKKLGDRVQGSTVDLFAELPEMPGLYWSRVLRDPCAIHETVMKSAAKGDQLYCKFGGNASLRSEWTNQTIVSPSSIAGRIQWDMMQWVKDYERADENSLAFACQKWLDPEKYKLDLKPHELFELRRKGDGASAWQIAEYCIRDSEAVLWIAHKRVYVPNVIEMSRVCWTSLDAVINGGQQQKVYSILATTVGQNPQTRDTLEGQNPDVPPLPAAGLVMNFGDCEWPMIDDDNLPIADSGPTTECGIFRHKRQRSELDDELPSAKRGIGTGHSLDEGYDVIDGDGLDRVEEESRQCSYQGATVLPPIPGLYDDPVCNLDFASLYPSIMQAQNLCYRTLINSPDEREFLFALPNCIVMEGETVTREELAEARTRYKHVVLKFDISFSLPRGGGEFKRSYYIYQSLEGVLPRVLKHLIMARKKVKKLKAKATNANEAAILSGREKALKVSCNSTYGFVGCSQETGKYPAKCLAAIVTLKGRTMIEVTKKLAEELYEGAQVVYGDTDSVMVRLPKSTFTDMQDAYTKGEALAAQISDVFEKPNELEMEHIKCPFLLLSSKKTYAAMVTERNGTEMESSLTIKGLDPIRRDKSKLQQMGQSIVVKALVVDGDVRKAFDGILDLLCGIVFDTHDRSLYIKSQTTKRSYKNLPAQWIAREKMIKRGEVPPPIGSRVKYIIVEPRTKEERTWKTSQLAENATYVLERPSIKIHRAYYLGLVEAPIKKVCEFVPFDVNQMFVIAHRWIQELQVSRQTMFGKKLTLSAFRSEMNTCF